MTDTHDGYIWRIHLTVEVVIWSQSLTFDKMSWGIKLIFFRYITIFNLIFFRLSIQWRLSLSNFYIWYFFGTKESIFILSFFQKKQSLSFVKETIINQPYFFWLRHLVKSFTFEKKDKFANWRSIFTWN